jgi:hypothetical protein
MATLAEIRAKYPQYSDLPDAALADALHKKFYADMPRADFDKRIGFEPSLPAVEVTPATSGQPVGEIPGPRQPSLYQQVRPYVAPIVETGGAIAGGIVGAPLGPAGAVGGAGLGYGIAKEALELADVYMGGKTPRQGAEQVIEPVQNVLEGSTMEVGGRLAGQYIGKAVGKIADLRQIPKQKAAAIVNEALGADRDLVLNSLRAAKGEAITAGQATADINSPTFQALVQRAVKRDPRFMRALADSEGEQTLNQLAKLAGGVSETEVRTAVQEGKTALNKATSPTREAALDRANLGKEVAALESQAAQLGEEAAAQVQKVRELVNAGKVAEAAARLQLIKKNLPVGFSRYTYPGELAVRADEWAANAANASLDLGQGARFAQAAADNLRAQGIAPLQGAPLAGKIKALANNPEFAGNDLVAGAVKNVADDIAKWTSSGGVIDAKALDAIRKNSVNAAIAQLRPGADASTQRNLASGVLAKVKPYIDDAIETAGGKGYKQYLEDYAKGAQQLAEQKLTGKALELYRTNKDAFVKLVEGNAPEEVEKILGSGKFDIAKEVSERTLDTLQNAAAKVVRDAKVKSQVEAGGDALKELLLQHMSKFRIPSYLSALTSTTNKALDILENKIGRATMVQLTAALKTPEGAANLIETLPAVERNRVLKILSNPASWKGGAGVSVSMPVTNALAPEQQNMLRND